MTRKSRGAFPDSSRRPNLLPNGDYQWHSGGSVASGGDILESRVRRTRIRETMASAERLRGESRWATRRQVDA
jgi:hypothetical protein